MIYETMLRMLCVMFLVLIHLVSDAQAQAPVLLGPGDDVLVLIPADGKLSELRATLDARGEVALGVYGRLSLGGQSEAQASAALAAHLHPLLSRTDGAQVVLQRSRTMVLVTGHVRQPGAVSLERWETLWHAIQRSGGALDGAELRGVVVLRGGKRLRADLHAYLTAESDAGLPPLESGDTIFVPAQAGMPTVSGAAGALLSEPALVGRVVVLGAVKAPGIYELSAGLDAVGALALANGPLPDADLAHARLISGARSEALDLSGFMSGRAAHTGPLVGTGGMILYVPARGQGQDNDFVEAVDVLGAVKAPGALELTRPQPLLHVLALAGGPTDSADFARVHHIQRGDGYSFSATYDLKAFAERGGVMGEVMVSPGDVVVVARKDDTAWRQTVRTVSDLSIVAAAFVLIAGAL